MGYQFFKIFNQSNCIFLLSSKRKHVAFSSSISISRKTSVAALRWSCKDCISFFVPRCERHHLFMILHFLQPFHTFLHLFLLKFIKHNSQLNKLTFCWPWCYIKQQNIRHDFCNWWRFSFGAYLESNTILC